VAVDRCADCARGWRPVVTGSVEIPDAAIEAACEVSEGYWGPAIPAATRAMVRDRNRRIIVAARPYLMPSREEIAEALHDRDLAHPWRSESCADHSCEGLYLSRANVVLALLSTSGESEE
jgi:hypothetical protein